jgi:crotonobetainyl-CoA:carnitine CoA-transferase CaiB-like acyl-CoA transferase
MMEKFWVELSSRMGRPELATDPRFCNPEARAQNRNELTELLDEAFSARTTDEWMEELAGVLPISPIYDVEQALTNPFVERTGLIQNVPHPAKPDMRMLANPLKIDGKRITQTAGSALGADNDAIFSALPEHEG